MSEGLFIHDVTNATCTGALLDQGAQVLRWAPRGAQPVVFVSSVARFQPHRSVRGGAPICWPWFGPGRFPGLEPLHGFVRTAVWECVERQDSETATTFRHRVTSDHVTSEQWQYPYAAELTSTFGDTLGIELTVTNTGEDVFDFEEAIHPYLVVGDVAQVRVEGVDGSPYIDKTTGGTRRVVSGAIEFLSETDAVITTPGPLVVVDPVLGRRLVIQTAGAANAVVWNPGAVKGAEIGDLGEGEWRSFVCVEAANAFEHAVTLHPGESHTLGFRVSVESL